MQNGRNIGWWVLVLAMAGCLQTGSGGGSLQRASISSGEPPNTAPPVNAVDDPEHPGIEACAVGDVDATLALVKDVEDSYHEMVVCGGLAASFSLQFVNLLIHAAFGESTGASGYTFDGEGYYSTGGVMDLSLHLAEETSFGQAGDIIGFDVFQLSNYFKSATVRAVASASLGTSTESEARGRLEVEFEEPGPGAELLGIDPDATSPVEIDFAAALRHLERIEMRGDIHVEDEHGDTTVRYVLRTEGVRIGDVLSSSSMPMELVDVEATSAATGQVVTVTDWGMVYQAGSSGTMDGTIDMEITGGDFDFGTAFEYPHRKTPDVSLHCL